MRQTGRMVLTLMVLVAGHAQAQMANPVADAPPARPADVDSVEWAARLEMKYVSGLSAEARRLYYAAKAEHSNAQHATQGKLHGKDKKRAELLALGWSADIVETILEKKVQLGMTPDMVRRSWGRPRDINRSIYASGVHEQWVYGEAPYSSYVYFDNDVLTAIQQ